MKTNNKSIYAFQCVLLLLCVAGIPPISAKTQEISLSQLMTRPGSIQLHGIEDGYRLSLPVSGRMQIDRAQLYLDFRNSNVLVPSRSQLRIRVNGITVGQFVLNPKSPHRLETIDLPPEILLPGYNPVDFQVAQHYTDVQCEAPDSPELWTEIDSVRSKFRLEGSTQKIPFRLSQLSTLMDEHLPNYPVTIRIPKLDEAALQWGALAAQGIALRLKYRTPQLSLAQPRPWPQSDANAAAEGSFLTAGEPVDEILIGTKQQLRPFLPQQVQEAIQGAHLQLLPLPQHPEHLLLVISGVSEDEVTTAVRAFALINFPFPDSSTTQVQSVDLPAQVDLRLPLIDAAGEYPFSQLGLATTSFSQSMRPEPAEVTLNLPPDFYVSEHANAVLSLHLAYSGGMRRDSVLEVRINDVLQHTIQLNEESGAHYRDYKIVFPMRNFAPGPNRITFRPILAPLITGECTYINTKNLNVTLFGDSTLTLAAVDHYTALPDLALFERSGFPYTHPADGSAVTVQVLEKTPGTVVAAWQVLAKLAQINHAPLWNAEIATTPTRAGGHLLVFGSSPSLPAELLKNAPVRISKTENLWSYRLWQGYETPVIPWWQRWLPAEKVKQAVSVPYFARIQQTGNLGEYGLLTAFQAPDRGDRLVTAFIAETPDKLANNVQKLVSPDLWGQLKGDIALWGAGEGKLAWQKSDKNFYLGHMSTTKALGYHFNRHPWQWLFAIVVILLLLAWIGHRLLARFKRRRHPDAHEIAP